MRGKYGIYDARKYEFYADTKLIFQVLLIIDGEGGECNEKD